MEKTDANRSGIDGYDPLVNSDNDAQSENLLNEATRRIIQNILKSYTGYFDVFNELT